MVIDVLKQTLGLKPYLPAKAETLNLTASIYRQNLSLNDGVALQLGLMQLQTYLLHSYLMEIQKGKNKSLPFLRRETVISRPEIGDIYNPYRIQTNKEMANAYSLHSISGTT